MPLNNMDAREVTMHYKRKGERVDEVLHDIVLNHVNRLEHENKRLREALEFYANKDNHQLNPFGHGYLSSYVMADSGYKARKALGGDNHA